MNRVEEPVKTVTILGCHKSMATTIFGPMDILNQAGRIWNRVHGTPQTPFFEVALASADGGPIECLNHVMIQPHCGIEAVDQTDLLVIASATYIDEILETGPGLVPRIRGLYDRGAHVASVCTGVFLLAETGLLNGKTATLHWGFTETLRRRYPQVDVREDRMILDHGRLYCAAGANAGLDLSLYLVEKFCGREIAVECARSMILDLGRNTQTPYAGFLFSRAHGDPIVTQAQTWIEDHPGKPLDYDRLARECRTSRRSLERRFKQATGVTPLGYMQEVRVEAAKRMLAGGGRTFDEITYLVGYEDVSFFRKVFVRLTGLRPGEYRQRFGPYVVRP